MEKVRTLKHRTKKELIMQEAKIDVVKVDIKANLYEDVIDTEATNALIDRKYELKKAKAKFLVGALAELKGILTEKQMASLKDLWRKKAD